MGKNYELIDKKFYLLSVKKNRARVLIWFLVIKKADGFYKTAK